MTEKMRALHALSTAGECTCLDIVDVTGIPSGRVFAALQALVREECAVSVKRDGYARYTITNSGRDQVNSWKVTPVGQGSDHV
ncbi:hypothetical protein [Streptomyces sp. NPDC056192]|uniref:hypothetical protein n=1 Tax=Streptomyces sp. NPDC056192 TaxID=3345743 RepID=UPI0035D96E15